MDDKLISPSRKQTDFPLLFDPLSSKNVLKEVLFYCQPQIREAYIKIDTDREGKKTAKNEDKM